jgi:hypothetical protein
VKVQDMARLSYELRLDEMEERSTSAAVGFFPTSSTFSSIAHVPGFQIANALVWCEERGRVQVGG